MPPYPVCAINVIDFKLMNELSLLAGIHSFTYNSHVDEETTLGPLYATGGPEGDGGDEAMRGSV